MNKRRTHTASIHRDSGAQGAVLIELAIVAPALLLLLFGAISFGIIMNQNQKAVFMARIAASNASRKCNTSVVWNDYDARPDEPANLLFECIEDLLSDHWNQDSQIFPGIKLILAVYREDGGAVTRPLLRGYEHDPASTDPGQGHFFSVPSDGQFRSHFDTVRIQTEAAALIANTETLFVAEVFVPNSIGFIPFLSKTYGSLLGEYQHVTAIF